MVLRGLEHQAAMTVNNGRPSQWRWSPFVCLGMDEESTLVGPVPRLILHIVDKPIVLCVLTHPCLRSGVELEIDTDAEAVGTRPRFRGQTTLAVQTFFFDHADLLVMRPVGVVHADFDAGICSCRPHCIELSGCWRRQFFVSSNGYKQVRWYTPVVVLGKIDRAGWNGARLRLRQDRLETGHIGGCLDAAIFRLLGGNPLAGQLFYVGNTCLNRSQSIVHMR